MAKLVYNIQPASPSMITALGRHCLTRVVDGASNIDPARSHLNRVLVGKPIVRTESHVEGGRQVVTGGLLESLEDFYAGYMGIFYGGPIKKPSAQAETPYLRIVVSASPEYFRPDDPEAIGTWDDDRLEKWVEATMNQLREEHGADLVYVELHLDEDTPHVHAVVAPTYRKKKRVPGKQKRNETEDQFEARKAVARADKGVRTVGRASHKTLSKQGSFHKLRQRMAIALDHLGIEYGRDRAVNAPAGMTTRQWVKEQAGFARELEDALKDVLERGNDMWEEGLEYIRKGEFFDDFTADHLPPDLKHRFPEIVAKCVNMEPDKAPSVGDFLDYKIYYDLWTDEPHDPFGAVEHLMDRYIANLRKLATSDQEQRLAAKKTAQDIIDAANEAAQGITDAAKEAAQGILDAAEVSAADHMEEARQRASQRDAGSDAWQAHTRLIQEKLKMNFGEEGHQKIKDAVNADWSTHPKNPERPLPKPAPAAGLGS